MSELKSVDRLRKAVEEHYSIGMVGTYEIETKIIKKELLLKWFDDIEREVAERFVELPVDADGVPIKPGDVLSIYGDKRICCEMRIDAAGHWEVRTLTSRHLPGEHGELHHYTPPTVDDVLRDFASTVNDPDNANDFAWHVAEYAKKLRLAEEGE